jgi:PAS domain S-box-containing protein
MMSKGTAFPVDILETAFEVARIGICFIDAEGRFVRVNPAFCDLIGYASEELIERHYSMLAPPDFKVDYARFTAALHADSAKITPEWRVRRKNGDVFDALVSFKAVRSENGSPLVVITYTDITGHNLALRKLRDSETLFRLIAESTTDMIAVVRVDGVRSYLSPSYRVLMGDPEQMVGTDSFAQVHPDDRLRIKRVFDRTVASGHGERAEYRFLTRDGATRHIESQSNVMLDTAGKVESVVVVSRDVTARKAAEEQLRNMNQALEEKVRASTQELRGALEALRDSEERTRLIIETANDAVATLSDGGAVTAWNSQAERMFGWQREDALGHALSELILPRRSRADFDALAQALVRAGPPSAQHGEWVAMRRDGSEFDVELSIWPVTSGSKIILSAFIRDITARKRAEEEIHQALEKERELSELKSRFVSMASHEFRTPLATIMSSAELLDDYLDQLPAAERIELLGMIKSAVQRMTGVIDQVLTIGRADAERVQFQPRPIDLTHLIEEIAQEIRRNLSAGQTLEVHNHHGGGLARLDEKLVRHILTNLISNAVKYSPQGGRIWLKVEAQGENVHFVVSDQGIGIPLEDQPRLFESFHRGRNVGNLSGTGLGLAIVKRSVDLHRGSISFDSEVGRGTTFRVLLPAQTHK